MKNIIKNVVKFLICLLPWFLSSLIFRTDTSFYDSIKKPFFAPPGIVFPIVWTILYILIAIGLYTNKNKNKSIDYYKSLIINYFSNQVFTFLFFIVKSPFIAFVDTLVVLISSLFLYNETKSKWFIPYVIWNVFATILSLSVYLLNI